MAVKRNKKGHWQPGESPNPAGRPPKGYSITEMMREMLNNDPKLKKAIGNSVAKKALEGDMTAIKTLWQYMDGMPEQNINQNIEKPLIIKLDGLPKLSTETDRSVEGTIVGQE